MNELTNITGNGPAAMSSREISELCEKQHQHVKRDIEIMFATLEIDASSFGRIYKDARNRDQEEYLLPKKETLLLVSGYSIALRSRIIDRLEELEGRHQSVTVNDLLANPTQLLALAQGYALQIEDLKRDIVVMKQDVNVLDRISKADDLYGIREASQLLQMQEKKFTEWLQRNGWCFRHSGYALHKLATYSKPDGTEGTRETLKFTTAGIVALAKRLNVALAAGDMFKVGVAA
jgi:hypothetical protein